MLGCVGCGWAADDRRKPRHRGPSSGVAAASSAIILSLSFVDPKAPGNLPGQDRTARVGQGPYYLILGMCWQHTDGVNECVQWSAGHCEVFAIDTTMHNSSQACQARALRQALVLVALLRVPACCVRGAWLLCDDASQRHSVEMNGNFVCAAGYPALHSASIDPSNRCACSGTHISSFSRSSKLGRGGGGGFTLGFCLPSSSSSPAKSVQTDPSGRTNL